MKQTEVIRKEINTLKPYGAGFAPISIGCPSRVHYADRSTFKKTVQETSTLYSMKKNAPKTKPKTIAKFNF
jgi:hypothetical protein